MNEGSMLVYLAYGSWQFRRQAVLSILSLVQMGSVPDKILVYTDSPDEFKKLPVEPVLLDKSGIKSWRGPYGFTHRAKIELLRSVYKKGERHVVLVDSDTFWMHSPSKIYESLQAGCAVMHKREHQLSDRFFPQYRAVLEQTDLIEKEGLPIVPVEQFWMYNAGVIGLPSTMNPDVLDQVLRMCDMLCRKIPLAMEWVEQVAFCYIFQGWGMRVETCEEELLHYWCDSFEFSRRLKKFSDDDLSELAGNPKRVLELIEEARKGRRSFLNQLLVRTKRLQRSFRKRKRELHVLAELLKQRIIG
ncbi:MAG: hypothetical protein ACP5IL_15660 [Syntrophobacteraceae bacterium]